ncbi:MAG: hypothetical protein WB511_02110 [Nitrososphaeraceae archaeon]
MARGICWKSLEAQKMGGISMGKKIPTKRKTITITITATGLIFILKGNGIFQNS